MPTMPTMPIRRVLLVAVAVCAVLAAVLGAVSLRGDLPDSSGAPASVATTCPGAPQRAIDAPGIPDGIIGGPAITPRNDCTPSFTEQDVRAYVRAHPESLMTDPHAPPPIVTRVQFMTSREVSVLTHGEPTGLADDAIVCYVALSGTFLPYSVPYGVTAHPYHSEVVVFDAHDGNILFYG